MLALLREESLDNAITTDALLKETPTRAPIVVARIAVITLLRWPLECTIAADGE